MAETMESIMMATLRKRNVAMFKKVAENAEKLLYFFPPRPEGYVPPPPAPPLPYEPSMRARQLLKDIRAAERKGKRGKALLAIIDAVLDEVDQEAEDRHGDW